MLASPVFSLEAGWLLKLACPGPFRPRSARSRPGSGRPAPVPGGWPGLR